MHGNIVSWSTKKQNTVSLSSTEAEYKALCFAVCESVFLKGILSDISVSVDFVVMYEDNQSCLHIAQNIENSKRLKHLDVKFHFNREKVQEKSIKLKYIQTLEQITDVLTKPLNFKMFNYFGSKSGVIES